MFPGVYCVGLLCVSLIYDTNSVIYEKMVHGAELEYKNEQNRNNFLLLETQVDYHFNTRLNKVATEIVTNVTNHVMKSIKDIIDIETEGHAYTSPCLPTALARLKKDAVLVVNDMAPCVESLQERYFNFTEEVQNALKSYSENKVALNQLTLTCDIKPFNIDCYARTVYNIEKSVDKYSALYTQIAMQMEELMFDELPETEKCFKKVTPELKTLVADVTNKTLKCLEDENKSKQLPQFAAINSKA